MTTYFQNKFRNETIRLQNWDYRWDGSYFITICTKNREHYFGEITNGKMNLSNIGVLADIFFHEIKNHSNNIRLNAFVVMPNHFHGIIIIGENEYNYNIAMSIKKDTSVNSFGPQSKNLSAIIRGFKSAVTKNARIINPEFKPGSFTKNAGKPLNPEIN